MTKCHIPENCLSIQYSDSLNYQRACVRRYFIDTSVNLSDILQWKVDVSVYFKTNKWEQKKVIDKESSRRKCK